MKKCRRCKSENLKTVRIYGGLKESIMCRSCGVKQNPTLDKEQRIYAALCNTRKYKNNPKLQAVK